MRFTLGGKKFQIDFRRDHGVVPGRTVTFTLERDDPNNPGATVFVDEERNIPTRYPYTTVTLFEVTKPGEREVFTPVRTATAGAHHKERFTLEKGRLAAIRALFPKRTKDNLAERALKEAVWDAYINRTKGSRG